MKKYLDKLKDFLKIAQKHLATVICAVLAILAVIACFWPTGSLFNDPTNGLVAKVNTSISTIQQIKSLTGTARSLPVMDPGSEVVSLSYFPNEFVVNQGKARVQQVHDQSELMLADAVSLNKHVPLYAAALFSGPPEARVEGTAEARTEFAKLYLDATTPNGTLPGDQRIRNWPVDDAQANRPLNEQIPALKAGLAPSDDDITAAKTDLQNRINAEYAAQSQQLAADTFADQSRTLLLDMARKAAEGCHVYLQPGALKQPAGVANFSGTTQAPSSSDIWDAQRYLWIQEDVATAVAYANQGSTNVMESPVKQIVDVELPTPYVFSAPTDQSSIKDDGQVPVMYDQSSSGHVSNGMYDVIHFTVVLDVEAGKIPDVLWQMQKGQLITVLDSHYKSVDSAAMLMTGPFHFIYGDKPVVELTMDCEELMLKDWVSKLEPPVVAAAPPANQ